MDISGIRRRSNAEEGSRRFFQTTNLIVSHFKRDADRKSIYYLSSEKNTLPKLLVASCAVHCYHYMGIRTKAFEEMVSNAHNTEAFENAEKKDLYNEINSLLGQMIQYELELSKHALIYEEKILKGMESGISLNDENFILGLKDQIEEDLVSALNKYPLVFFYDHLGELTGYTKYVKNTIMEEASELKAISVELEQALSENIQDKDKFIELTTLDRLIEKLKTDFEFSSLRDLKLETFPIRKMLTRILNYRLNVYPVSKRGITSFIKATELKRQIYEQFSKANNDPVEYNLFEDAIIKDLTKNLAEQASKSANEFLYFIENLLESGFNDIYDILSRFGIYDLPMFCEIQKYNTSDFFNDLKLNQITKMTLVRLNSADNEFHRVETKLNDMKKRNLCVTERSVFEILATQKAHELGYLKDACEMAQVKFEDLMTLYLRQKSLELIIQKKYPIKWLSGYILLFDLQDIFQNLAKHIYFTFFSKICRQIARILETYSKLKDDRSLILLGLKRIFDAAGLDEWVNVKIEELIINRLCSRQKELTIIFNAENQTFLVNAFILARLFDTTLSAGLEILKNEPSSIYENIADISLPHELISPISYVIAYDILKRFKGQQQIKQIQKEQLKEEKDEKSEKQLVDLKKAQELNTLNFIEKKITSTMMTLKKNFNPTALYWSEKDQKQTMDSIKLHSELTGRKICAECGNDTTINNCASHPNSSKDTTPLSLFIQYYSFSLKRIKEMWEKTKIPDYKELSDEVKGWINESMSRRLRKDIGETESKQIIEGERFEVAKNIAASIGAYLDKALYKKFKDTLK